MPMISLRKFRNLIRTVPFEGSIITFQMESGKFFLVVNETGPTG